MSSPSLEGGRTIVSSHRTVFRESTLSCNYRINIRHRSIVASLRALGGGYTYRGVHVFGAVPLSNESVYVRC